MVSQDRQLHPCDTDSENISLLTNNSNLVKSRVFTSVANIFSSLIDGCLKYKNKEKPKTGPRPGPLLNYDVKIGPKPSPRGVKKSGPIGAGLKCSALARIIAFFTILFLFKSYCQYIASVHLTDTIEIKMNCFLQTLKVITGASKHDPRSVGGCLPLSESGTQMILEIFASIGSATPEGSKGLLCTIPSAIDLMLSTAG